MRYLLDSNTCIRYINGRAPQIRQRFLEVEDADIAISTVTMGEMYAGSAKSHTSERSRARQDAFFVRFANLPFDTAAAHVFGQIRANLEQSGTPIGPYDLQIAAIAIANDLTLVTHNTKEFARVRGLSIED